MKRFGIIALLALFFAGCGNLAGQSEFWQHESMYKNWEHTRFSVLGYQNPTPETGKKSQEQGWWGTEIPYIPAE
ncbi:MAG: hypothetical protein R6V46_04785 [Desulfatiglandaceae bacterium]|jgi:hypothetical protein